MLLENKVTRVIHNKLEDVLHGVDMIGRSKSTEMFEKFGFVS